MYLVAVQKEEAAPIALGLQPAPAEVEADRRLEARAVGNRDRVLDEDTEAPLEA